MNQLYRVYNGSNTSRLLEEYVYHPIEERVWIKKTYNSTGNLTETVYYLSKEFVMLVNKTGTFNFTYVYLDEQLVAQVLTSSGVINQADGPEGDGISPLPSQITTTQFILTDHKGSVVVVTNASGKVIENTTYSPYGQIISGGSKSRYDYEGKEYDSITKTYDFNFRMYNPYTQTFGIPDDRIFPYDPQKLNRYMFERGNPWKNVDPDGHYSIPLALLAIAGATWGGYKLSEKLEALEEQQGGLTEADVFFTAIEIGANVASFKNFLIPFTAKQATKEVTTSYFEQRFNIAHTKNVLTHISNNADLDSKSRIELMKSVLTTSKSDNIVTWYFNPETKTYTYRIGTKHPGGKYQKIVYGGQTKKESAVKKNTVPKSQVKHSSNRRWTR